MSDETGDVEWRPLVIFTDDPSPSYTHGFEAGMVWQQMQDRHADIHVTAHVENEGTFRNMANAAGYDLDWHVMNDADEGWAAVSLHRRPHVGHLGVVK